jgi:hypothetical protein
VGQYLRIHLDRSPVILEAHRAHHSVLRVVLGKASTIASRRCMGAVVIDGKIPLPPRQGWKWRLSPGLHQIFDGFEGIPE